MVQQEGAPQPQQGAPAGGAHQPAGARWRAMREEMFEMREEMFGLLGMGREEGEGAEGARERRLRMMRLVMRGAGGRGPRAALTLHMKEFLRPLGANQARTRLRTVIKELELCMKKYSGLDWQPLGHLLAAAQGLEEAQRVAMYGQVFAFYLGCVPRLEASEAPRAPGPLGLALQARSGFTRRPYAETDPR